MQMCTHNFHRARAGRHKQQTCSLCCCNRLACPCSQSSGGSVGYYHRVHRVGSSSRRLPGMLEVCTFHSSTETQLLKTKTNVNTDAKCKRIVRNTKYQSWLGSYLLGLNSPVAQWLASVHFIGWIVYVARSLSTTLSVGQHWDEVSCGVWVLDTSIAAVVAARQNPQSSFNFQSTQMALGPFVHKAATLTGRADVQLGIVNAYSWSTVCFVAAQHLASLTIFILFTLLLNAGAVNIFRTTTKLIFLESNRHT